MKKAAFFLMTAAVLLQILHFPAASAKTVSGMCGAAAAFTMDENGQPFHLGKQRKPKAKNIP